MAGLALNGIELPVALDGLQRRVVVIGDRFRGFDGTPRKTDRARKSEWAGTLALQEQAAALAWRGLINGDGHHWSWDADLYSDKGLGTSSSSGATAGVGGGLYGNRLQLAATTGQATWGTGASAWTAAVWRYESAAWHHYVVRSDAARWVDGSVSAGAAAWLVVTSTAVQLVNTAGSAQYYDDFVFLPYSVPSDWPPLIYAEMNARAWSALPRLRATGDLVPNAPVTVEGAASDSPLIGHMSGGAWAAAGETPAFLLQEV